jgi:streptogramin lyase
MDTSRRIAPALLFVACFACSRERPAPANPLAGQARLNLLQKASSAKPAAVREICATFTITPYSLDASGAGTLAGSPVTVSSGSGGTDAILGCIDTPGVTPDWRYVVTASHFAACDGSTVNGIAPAIETFTVDLDCKAGLDVSAQIIANVEIPVPNAGGYLDIGVGVNVETPQAGCKLADIDASNQLHFGQSYVAASGDASPAPSAYTGIGVFGPQSGGPGDAQIGTATPAGSLKQFEGSVSANGSTDAFFTGLLQLPSGAGAVTVVQAFAKACPGQMTLQPRAVECVTQVSGGHADTQVQVADLFAAWPGHAAVSATIDASGVLNLQTSLGGQHLGSLAPPVTGHDDLTRTQQLTLPPSSFLAVYGSLLQVGQLFVLTQDPALGIAVVSLTLDETTGKWSAAAPVALSSFTTAQQQAMGLFGSGGCFPLPLAPPGTLAYQPGALACTVGSPCALGAPVSSGGAPVTYSIGPAVPPGLTFDPATGAITGTATGASATTTYTVTATNAAGTSTTTLTITVSPPECDFTEWDVTAPGTGGSWMSVDHDDTIWFSEQVSNRLAHLDPASNALTEWTLPGNTIDAWSYGVSADGAGRAFYMQSGESGAPTALSPNLIGLLDPAASTITQWDVAGLPASSGAFLVDFTGAAWFSIFQIGQVARFDPLTSTMTRWAAGANIEGIVERGGLVYFAEDYYRAIGRLDPATNTVTRWPIPGGFGAYEPQFLISVDDAGDIWFTTNEFNVAGRLDPATGSFDIWQEPTLDCPGGGCYLYGIEADSHGTVWTTDYVGRIWSFSRTSTPSFSTIVTPSTFSAAVTSAVITPRVQALTGTTRVVTPRTNVIAPDTSGVFRGCRVPDVNSGPTGIAIDHKDQVWYANYGAPGGVGRLVLH